MRVWSLIPLLVLSIISIYSPSNAHGFTGTTLVDCHSEFMTIAELSQVSENRSDYTFIPCYKDTDPGGTEYFECIERVGKGYTFHFVRILLDDETTWIVCAPHQPFYSVTRHMWVPAYEITPFDRLQCRYNKTIGVRTILWQPFDNHVHTLQIKNAKTFFVTKHSVLAHNYAIAAAGLPALEWVIGTGCVLVAAVLGNSAEFLKTMLAREAATQTTKIALQQTSTATTSQAIAASNATTATITKSVSIAKKAQTAASTAKDWGAIAKNINFTPSPRVDYGPPPVMAPQGMSATNLFSGLIAVASLAYFSYDYYKRKIEYCADYKTHYNPEHAQQTILRSCDAVIQYQAQQEESFKQQAAALAAAQLATQQRERVEQERLQKEEQRRAIAKAQEEQRLEQEAAQRAQEAYQAEQLKIQEEHQAVVACEAEQKAAEMKFRKPWNRVKKWVGSAWNYVTESAKDAVDTVLYREKQNHKKKKGREKEIVKSSTGGPSEDPDDDPDKKKNRPKSKKYGLGAVGGKWLKDRLKELQKELEKQKKLNIENKKPAIPPKEPEVEIIPASYHRVTGGGSRSGGKSPAPRYNQLDEIVSNAVEFEEGSTHGVGISEGKIYKLADSRNNQYHAYEISIEEVEPHAKDLLQAIGKLSKTGKIIG